MEKDSAQIRNSPLEDIPLDTFFSERRTALAQLYSSLPPHDSILFWSLCEGCQDNSPGLPMEVLVKILRGCIAQKDESSSRRLFEIILGRLQSSNEQWVNHVLSNIRLLTGERCAIAADLYADLCERLLRLLRDDQQYFWEENFQHSLRFARKHVYEDFMRREGHWLKRTPGKGWRVPQALLISLERTVWPEEDNPCEVSDDRVEVALQAVAQADLVALLTHLPARLRALLWLIFWEDCTTKSAGQLLGISDRTARNWLRTALAQLRQILENEQEVFDGESA